MYSVTPDKNHYELKLPSSLVYQHFLFTAGDNEQKIMFILTNWELNLHNILNLTGKTKSSTEMCLYINRQSSIFLLLTKIYF